MAYTGRKHTKKSLDMGRDYTQLQHQQETQHTNMDAVSQPDEPKYGLSGHQGLSGPTATYSPQYNPPSVASASAPPAYPQQPSWHNPKNPPIYTYNAEQPQAALGTQYIPQQPSWYNPNNPPIYTD